MGKTMEKGISDIVGVFTDPIIAYPSPWMDTIPDRLKERITLDRLIMCMRVQKGEEPTGTDSEALAYLYPLTLEAPLDHNWVQIYLYLGTKVFGSNGQTMPDDIRRDSLDDEQMKDLDRLKAWIYERRIKVRLDRDRGERREKKEEEAAAREAAQPALFNF